VHFKRLVGQLGSKVGRGESPAPTLSWQQFAFACDQVFATQLGRQSVRGRRSGRCRRESEKKKHFFLAFFCVEEKKKKKKKKKKIDDDDEID
jgi:hypothetical protein